MLRRITSRTWIRGPASGLSVNYSIHYIGSLVRTSICIDCSHDQGLVAVTKAVLKNAAHMMVQAAAPCGFAGRVGVVSKAPEIAVESMGPHWSTEAPMMFVEAHSNLLRMHIGSIGRNSK
jgi:hypothetical protein